MASRQSFASQRSHSVRPETPQLTGVNYLNALGWIVSAAVLVCSYLGYFGRSPQEVMFEAYPTLLTPHWEVYVAWVPVIAGELVFVLFQFIPAYRQESLVQVTGPWWLAICFFQAFYFIEISRVEVGKSDNNISWAMGAMLVVQAFLLALLLSMDLRKPSFLQYWLIRAPFSLHAGWILIMSAVSVNMYVELQGFVAASKVAVAVFSLIMIFVLSALFAVDTRRPDPIIPIPVAWGCYWIFAASKESPVADKFEPDVINGIGFAALQVAIGAVWCSAIAGFLRMVVCCRNCGSERREARRSVIQLGEK